MSLVSIERIGDEPIIHAVITGYADVEDLLEFYRRTSEMRKDMPPHIYRIMEVKDFQSTFLEMMQIIKQATSHTSSSSIDPTITPIIVGTNHWVQLFTDALRQGTFNAKQIFVFGSLDEALAYVRADIAIRKAQS